MSAFQNFLAGHQYGTGVKQQREAAKKEEAFNQLAAQAYSATGDARNQLVGQAVGVDAGRGMQLGEALGGDEERRNRTVANAAKLLISAPEEYRPAVWQQIRPGLSTIMPNLPTDYAPEVLQAAESINAVWGGPKDQNLAPRVVGNALVDSKGKVLYESQPQQEYQWSDRAGAWIPKPMASPGATTARESSGRIVSLSSDLSPQDRAAIAANPDAFAAAGEGEGEGEQLQLPPIDRSAYGPGATGGGLAAIPVAGVGPKPDISPAEERRLQLAEQAAQRAAEAADRARFGNAPAGFRFKPDGSLEAIPGGPKPAGSAATEGERKAATLLQRLNFSVQQLETAVKENPDAASPGVLGQTLRGLPLIGETAANFATSQERQRVEAAQLDILDAALTLGTGAAYTREQLEGYRRAYFPQIGDSEQTIRDKAARLNNVIEAARISAGRAAPETGSGAAPRPVAPRGQSGAQPKRLRFNPATGRLE